MSTTTADVVAGLVIVVGVIGVVVPVVPGILLVWGAVLGWAIADSTTAGWVALAIVTVLVGGSQVLKYLVPGRRLKRAGVPSRTLIIGGAAGIVGFFVIPIIGVLIGFVAGVYLAERTRLGDHRAAWTSARHALTAAGLSMLIELAAALACATVWVVAAFVVG